jgi:protease-4
MNLQRPLILISVSCLAALLVFALGLRTFGAWQDERAHEVLGYHSGCNIAVVSIQGDLVAYDPVPGEYNYVTTSGDSVVSQIAAADANPSIKGILLQIDSGGGSPAAAEQIMKAMQGERLPTLAYIREEGDSGGYLAATGANTIIASDYADVGSIGVTESYVQQTQQDAQNGQQFISIASGPYKDALNPDNPITPAQKALAQQEVDAFAQIFISEVAQNRRLPTSTIESLADGSSFTAQQAVADHLIDAVGDVNTVTQWFKDKIGTHAVLCTQAE